ncbi:hypothetical protein B2J86_00125 [Acidovorax sp. SRB_14]|uniref:hypothetical protein n=1 Tax=unclassified Acidovorax TaxID=2684926 RepID=UPI00145E6108|nr:MULTISPECIES: hypothetical protein [unclassified Acidovorax]NMM76527.1 hypothetical protein [Acidovorax sp. SRB_24]NMM79349.1 hypothetical protein [Acidovorax sp. SRB_14]NMM84601.1 hypothetical protein [Rhodococcus sp. SRB_17]
MATPNYGYEKRQRELAKKKKKEEKLRAKSAAVRRPDGYAPEQQDSAPAGASDASGTGPGNQPG